MYIHNNNSCTLKTENACTLTFLQPETKSCTWPGMNMWYVKWYVNKQHQYLEYNQVYLLLLLLFLKFHPWDIVCFCWIFLLFCKKSMVRNLLYNHNKNYWINSPIFKIFLLIFFASWKDSLLPKMKTTVSDTGGVWIAKKQNRKRLLSSCLFVTWQNVLFLLINLKRNLKKRG